MFWMSRFNYNCGLYLSREIGISTLCPQGRVILGVAEALGPMLKRMGNSPRDAARSAIDGAMHELGLREDKLMTSVSELLGEDTNSEARLPDAARVDNEAPKSPSQAVQPEGTSSAPSVTKVVEIVAGTLSTQAVLMGAAPGSLPLTASDDWSLGYIGGYSDGFFQRSGIGVDDVGLGALAKIFMVLFGDDDGAEKLGEYLALQQLRNERVMAGMQSGGDDAFAWLKNNDAIPMKWADYVRQAA